MGFSTASPPPTEASATSITVAAPTVQVEETTKTKTTATTTTTPAVPKTTTTAYVCCPEYADNHDCEALCALNTQVSDLEAQIAAILAALMGKKLRMRQARSAVDPDLE